jgi:hypothetical protein
MTTKNKTTTQHGSELTWFDRLSSSRKGWICISVMALITVIMFLDILFGGMIFAVSGDAAAFNAWTKAMDHIRTTENHKDVFWIPYIFSGIPIHSTLLLPKEINYVEYVILRFPLQLIASNWAEVRDVIYLLLGGIFMYMLSRSFKFSHLASLVAGLTLMLNPYAIGVFQSNQGSKLQALAMIPLLFLFTYQLYHQLNSERILYWKNILYFGLLSIVTALLLFTLHVQIIFYGLMLIGFYILFELITSIKSKPTLTLKSVVIVGLALLIGAAISAYIYLPTQEYAQYSIRGGGTTGSTGGLDYDYATNWSFHPFEIMNYLIPSFFGYASPFYWGWMPFTESTVYIGVVQILLLVFALIYRRNKLTWFLVIFSVIMFFISFGRHFGLLYDLMFNYFPYFNKFRVPVLILHLMPITFGILAAIGLTVLSEMGTNSKSFNIEKLRKGLFITLGIIGAILLIGLVANETVYSSLSGSMFQRPDDLQQLRQQYGAEAPQVLTQLKKMRFDLLWKDYIKFALIIGVCIGLILAYLKRKLNFTMLTAALIVVLLVDLLILDTKLIEPKPDTAKTDFFQPDQTTKFLKSDRSNYRIFPVSQGAGFQDNTWMYHAISSIGGYSPAKLKIYQEMIDSLGLYPPRLPLNINMASMLGAKYVVVPGQLPDTDMPIVNVDQSKQMITYLNPGVLPRAFFVDSIFVANTKMEIFNILSAPSWNPKSMAVLEKKPANLPVKSDSTFVRFTRDWSEEIVLETYCSTPALLVLSDAYYPAGWSAYVDGNETEIYKTNYVVRSVVVPAGKHTVEYRFKPTSVYYLGYDISHGAYAVSFIVIVFGLIRMPWMRRKLGLKQTEDEPKQENS